MYPARHFEETRIEVLDDLMRAHPLSTWVAVADLEPVVAHVPFLLDAARGPFGMLRGHVVRTNPIWQRMTPGSTSVAVFQGPESYITPSWYPSKHAHGKAVPTWNYAVVHAYGRARFVEEEKWLLDHVTKLTHAHESSQASPWQVSDAPSSYVDTMLERIIGVELPIAELRGIWKMSQNRSADDRLGVVAGLEAKRDARSAAVAAMVKRADQENDAG